MAPRPASNTNVSLPASTSVLGPNRFIIGPGFPVPSSVILMHSFELVLIGSPSRAFATELRDVQLRPNGTNLMASGMPQIGSGVAESARPCLTRQIWVPTAEATRKNPTRGIVFSLSRLRKLDRVEGIEFGPVSQRLKRYSLWNDLFPEATQCGAGEGIRQTAQPEVSRQIG